MGCWGLLGWLLVIMDHSRKFPTFSTSMLQIITMIPCLYDVNGQTASTIDGLCFFLFFRRREASCRLRSVGMLARNFSCMSEQMPWIRWKRHFDVSLHSVGLGEDSLHQLTRRLVNLVLGTTPKSSMIFPATSMASAGISQLVTSDYQKVHIYIYIYTVYIIIYL